VHSHATKTHESKTRDECSKLGAIGESNQANPERDNDNTATSTHPRALRLEKPFYKEPPAKQRSEPGSEDVCEVLIALLLVHSDKVRFFLK
jgi:hypothetical protein